MTIAIRAATVSDAAAIAAIYAHHVLNGTASYEVTPPTGADTETKVHDLKARGWPFLVACDGAQVIGYCYVTQFRDRPAYAFACENSIYVAHDHAGNGIGRALLKPLLDAAEAFGFRQMVAVIGGAEPALVALHRSFGFTEVGRLPAIGWKAGKWLDSVYMQISLECGAGTPPVPSDRRPA